MPKTEKVKAKGQSFSFDAENEVILNTLKKVAKDNRRTLSAELCARLEKSFEAEGIRLQSN